MLLLRWFKDDGKISSIFVGKAEVSKGSALAGFIQKIRNKKIRMCQF